jgi:hypothetical protein
MPPLTGSGVRPSDDGTVWVSRNRFRIYVAPRSDFCRGGDPVSGAVEQHPSWRTDNRPCSDGASGGLGIQRVSVLVLLNLPRGD